MNKRSVIIEIDEILSDYCDGCFVKRQLREESGKKTAHRFCIDQCTVGRQLQFLGGELSKLSSKTS